MKYIDSEKLIAEIESRKKELFTIGGDTFENKWACGALDSIKEFITSLQRGATGGGFGEIRKKNGCVESKI